MALNLEALTLLELIESRGSFAAAAIALNKAPSAITYQLRQLEESLDVLVYDRTGHKAQLTPAGKVLLQEGRLLLENSELLSRKVKAVASGWEAELRIVLDCTIAFDLVIAWIDAFDQLKAPTRLRFSSEVLSGTWEALYSDRADLLIGSRLDQNQFASSTGLHIQSLGESRFVFAVAANHPLADQAEPLSNDVIRMHRAVAVGDTSRHFKPLTFGLQNGQQVLTVASLEDKLKAQLAGLGCGWLPWNLIQTHLAEGSLILKETEESDRNTKLCTAWRRCNQGKALQWWIEFLSGIELQLTPHTTDHTL